jgi:hypothetical protein
MERLKKLNHLKSIYLKGSRVSGDVDYWSDDDYLLVLESVDHDEINTSINDLFGPIYAKQTFEFDEGTTLRLVTDLGQFDLQIVSEECLKKYPELISKKMRHLYGSKYEPVEPATYEHNSDYEGEKIQDNWFKFYECVKKYCRNDFLIGYHLYLGLKQELLVLEMIKRDKEKNTNIHRHGEGKLPIECLVHSNNGSLKEYLVDIKALAITYDKTLKETYEMYQSPLGHFLKFLDTSLEKVSE